MPNQLKRTYLINIFLIFIVFFYSKITAAENIPTVNLKYANLFDIVCSNRDSYKIEPILIEELERILPTWQKSWDQEGGLLLKTAMEIVDKPFPQNHYTVPLSLCNFPSMSEPLMVNIRYALKNFTKYPINTNVTISVVEHEILHTYIDSFLPKNSSLLKKYQNESQAVLNHLHLLALQKAIYLKLGQNKILKDVIAKDNSLPNGDYKRAWEIVNNDGYASFVNELKSK